MKTAVAPTRWAVFADTHGNTSSMRDAVGSERFDAIVHLGDGVRDAEAVARERGCVLHAVAGNEDGDCGLPERLVLPLGGKNAVMMHGHRMDVSPYLVPPAWDRRIASMDALMVLSEANLLLFGHSHVPLLRKTERGIICNPGSHYIGSQLPPTYAIVESAGGSLAVRLYERGGDGWDMMGEAVIS